MGNSSSSCLSTQFRSDSISGIFSITDDSDEDRICNSYQKIILRAAWKHMSSRASHGSCGKAILKRLSLKDARIKEIFHHFALLGNVFDVQERHAKASYCSFENHAKLFLQFLQFLMENLDTPKVIAERCETIGRYHRRFKVFGLKTEHWDLFGESIVETLRWRRHRQAAMSTNLLMSFVIDRIRSGFLQRLEIPSWVRTPHPTIDVPSQRSSLKLPKKMIQYENNEKEIKYQNPKKHVIRSKSYDPQRRRQLPMTPDDLRSLKHQDLEHHQGEDVSLELHSLVQRFALHDL